MIQSPYRFSNAAAGVRGPAPYRGEHNAYVLHEWIDLDDETLTALGRERILLAEEPDLS